MKRSVLILTVALSIAGCRGGHAAERVRPIIMPAANAMPPDRTLTTSGKATLQIEPDLAIVSVRLEVERVSTSTRAASQLAAMKASLLAKVDKLGIKSSQAVASHTQIRPIYSPHQERKLRRIVGYNAWAEIVVELQDFDRMGPVIDAAVKSGGTNVRTSFKSTQLTEHKRTVYDMALKAARSKAEQMAGVLDIESMRVRTVAEGQLGGGWYGWQTSHVANAVDFAPAGQAGATASVTPGAKELTLTISVVYEIL